MKDIDPDDSFSRVPYEKGFSLLHYLEAGLGLGLGLGLEGLQSTPLP